MLKLVYKKRKIKRGETPQKLYERLRTSHSCLMESGKEGRYSFIGYEPFLVLVGKGNFAYLSSFEYLENDVNHSYQPYEGDVLEFLHQLIVSFKVEDSDKNLPPFIGGACGFFSYDFGLSLNKIESKTKDDLNTPDLYFPFFDKVICFDHQKGELYFLALGEDIKKAKNTLAKIESDAREGSFFAKEMLEATDESSELKSNLTFEAYSRKLKQIKKYLEAGETYQVNFAQRFQISSYRDPFSVYQKLTKLNSSPQSCFIDGEDFAIVSSSPERLVSVQNGVIETWPIKGTIARGKSKKEDAANAKKLLDSMKNEAELTMIVDLARNDLGKVCKKGSVKVLEHRKIISYSHVIHTVSIVRGELKKQIDEIDIIRALFPGGSITGCPKKRTMEIINKLEEFNRGVYCGSAGYFSASGNMDFNILIRTIYYNEQFYTFHAGGGIVLDSEAKEEYEETLQKAQALKQSLF